MSFFVLLLLCIMKNIFGIFSTEEKVDAESVMLTCLTIPVLVLLGDSVAYVSEWNFVFHRVCGFFGCFTMVFGYVLGCCALECLIIGKQYSKLQAFRNKGVGVMILLSACMLLAGVSGGISLNLGYGTGFLSYCIVTIVFVITNIPEKSLRKALRRWKEKDGIFLMLMKLMVAAISIGVKTLFLLFFITISTSYEWLRDINSTVFEIIDKWAADILVCIIPCVLVLYVAAVFRRKSEKQKIYLIWGIVMLAECFLSGMFGMICYLAYTF